MEVSIKTIQTRYMKAMGDNKPTDADYRADVGYLLGKIQAIKNVLANGEG